MKAKDNTVGLVLGGNLNDVPKTFDWALDEIGNLGVVQDKSGRYVSKAWGMDPDTPDFLNQAVILVTDLNPAQLLAKLKDVESSLGREVKTTGIGYHSRIIDIDIIFYEDQVIDLPELIVPHPRMHERKFVLKPLQEVAESWKHPLLNKSVSELLRECDDPLHVEKDQK